MIEEIVGRSEVRDILFRALDGERLSAEDGIRLFQSDDLPAIGAVANEIRRRLNGDRTYYVVNRHINYTDICCNRCAFCAFSRSEDDRDAYVMPVDEIVDRAAELYDAMRFTELHIVGGCHPKMPFEYYTSMLESLKSSFPEVHLQAFTAVEIAHIADTAGISIRQTLARLRDAGLGSIPGGGAEVFAPRVRRQLCPEKLSAEKWLDVMREAHMLGIKSNATMLYGHIETDRERVEHILALRELQDSTGGFMSFIPLKFHPSNTRVDNKLRLQSAIDDLKVYSISRLMLDNVPHVKVFWIMLGIKLAQVALSFGADDFDGTVVEEKITHRAGAATPEGLAVPQIKALIEETGTVPIERDTLYNEVVRDEVGLPALLKR
ncbi:MAG: aminofutalosine synthase MqnE [Armatimonadetes bacterium]|nr:aminofutalosine synthase MqnE [Armatimonadota bacterium]